MTKPKQLVKIAVITQPHGIAGEFKVKFTNKEFDPFSYKNYYLDSNIINPVIRGKVKDVAIFKISNCDNRDKALSLKGKIIYIARDEFPEIKDKDEYYIDDLLDIAILNNEGKVIGKITNMENFGAGDIITIKFNNGQLVDFPFKSEIFSSVDLANKTIIFTDPEII